MRLSLKNNNSNKNAILCVKAKPSHTNEQPVFTNNNGQDLPQDSMNGSLVKTPRRRKRVLSFEELDDLALLKETKEHIQRIKSEIEDKKLISLKEWCNERDISVAAMIDLFKDANLPVIRIGGFDGVYEVHLSRVLNKEAQRQLQQQIQNRVCARVLTERYHANKEAKVNNKMKKKQEIKTDVDSKPKR